MSSEPRIRLPQLNIDNNNSSQQQEENGDNTTPKSDMSISPPAQLADSSATSNISPDLFTYNSPSSGNRRTRRARRHLLRHSVERSTESPSHSLLKKYDITKHCFEHTEISYNDSPFIYSGISYFFKKYLLKNSIEPNGTVSFYVNVYFLQNIFQYFNKKTETKSNFIREIFSI